jgi:hypothetical protein
MKPKAKVGDIVRVEFAGAVNYGTVTNVITFLDEYNYHVMLNGSLMVFSHQCNIAVDLQKNRIRKIELWRATS